jgi:murein DD-endopeptidase
MTRAGHSNGLHTRFSLAALALLFLSLAGCSSVPVQTDPDADTESAPQQAGRDVGIDAVRAALRMVGVPYRYGGSTPDGFDCSGLVQYSYAIAGRRLPRSAEEQAASSRPVSRSQVRPGDLLFFHLNGTPSHVALYVGNGRFVHAPTTGKFVSTAHLSNPFWRRNLAGVRRLPLED